MRNDNSSDKNSEEQYDHRGQGGLDIRPPPRPLAVAGLLAVAGHARDLLVRALAHLAPPRLLHGDLLRPTNTTFPPRASQGDACTDLVASLFTI